MCANLSATWNGVRIRKLKLKWKKHKIYLRWWWKIYFNDFVFINIHNWKKDVHFIAIWSALRFIFVGADDQSFYGKLPWEISRFGISREGCARDVFEQMFDWKTFSENIKGKFLDSIENTKHESSVFKPFRSVSMINGNKFCSFTAQNLMKMRIFAIETSNH